MSESYIYRPDFYLYKCSPEKREETKKRLTQISEMGMTEVGIANFGVEGIMSGLYIEKVWRYSDKEWGEYIDWADKLIKQKTVK